MHFEFGQGVRRRLDDSGRKRLHVERPLVVVKAVDLEIVHGMKVAVRDEPADAAGDGIGGGGCGSRDEEGEFRITATGQREFDGHGALDDLAEGGLFGLDDGGVGADVDGFGGVGDVEAESKKASLGDVQNDGANLGATEAGSVDGERVGSGQKRGEGGVTFRADRLPEGAVRVVLAKFHGGGGEGGL